MKMESVTKYRPYRPISLPDRTWPDTIIDTPPRWCSVDLRDGNQALIIPMNLSQKMEMFQLLVDVGFKEIEVGFPSASQVEFDFLRTLVDKGMIPDDVTVQVLTQAREHLIRRTFEALRGVKRAVLHLYNSTSELQRRVVFQKDRDAIRDIAVEGTRLIKSLVSETDTHITLEYSPESFSGTEVDYAVEVCEAVMDVWEPTEENKIILNLPATVEMSTPNVYADQIEWFCRTLKNRDRAVISIHTHNDRGTAVAATELALMAGGDRVEGTLFGNGERTGNVDILTVALNLFSQGIDPELDFSRINHLVEVYERCTRIPVHVRHPYAGELVYTAFSGSHQDAINKGLTYREKSRTEFWEVPYLPIDPEDVGRSYEAIIRINSQSGKGGVAYIMEKEYGYQLPKTMHPDFASVIQNVADSTGKEVMPDEMLVLFRKEYLEREEPYAYLSFSSSTDDSIPEEVTCRVKFLHEGKEMVLEGRGNGPIDACKNALREAGLFPYSIENYYEHALEHGSDSRAISYIQIREETGGKSFYGAGIDANINRASVKALFSAMNRAVSRV